MKKKIAIIVKIILKYLKGSDYMGRKFIRFSNAELDTIGKALKEYGASDLLKQVEKEKAQREYDTKVLEEWMGTEQRKM